MSIEKAIELLKEAKVKYGGIQPATPINADGVMYYRQGNQMFQVICQAIEHLESEGKSEPPANVERE